MKNMERKEKRCKREKEMKRRLKKGTGGREKIV